MKPLIHPAVLFAILLLLLTGCNTSSPKTSPREGYLQLPGGKVWYRIVGTGKKTPLVVLHGGPGVPSYYLKPLAGLGEDRPVIFYDQSGCGHSDGITDTALMTIPHFVEELKQLRDSLCLKEFYLYGQSWGTMLAADYYLVHPEGVKGIVFSSPALSIKRWMEDSEKQVATLPDSLQQIIRINEANKTYDSPDYARAMKYYYEKYVARKVPWSADIDSSFTQIGGNVYLYMEGPSEFTITGTIKDYDRTGQLPMIKIPTLFIAGEFDEAPPSTVQYYSSLTPGSKFQVIKGAGHMTMQDNAADHNKVVEEFLESNEK